MGMWSGRRDKYLERYKSTEHLDWDMQSDVTSWPCTLQIHFSVAVMLGAKPKANTPLGGSEFDPNTHFQRRGWRFPGEKYLWEANVNSCERARLDRWKEESTKASRGLSFFWNEVIHQVVGRYEKCEGKMLIDTLMSAIEKLETEGLLGRESDESADH